MEIKYLFIKQDDSVKNAMKRMDETAKKILQKELRELNLNPQVIYGADVYQADDILPKLEKFKGKGENLWKALYITTGDIIERVREKKLDPHIVQVGEAMSYPLVSVLNGTAVNVAVDLMLEHSIMRLPIMENSQLVEILTRVEMPNIETVEVYTEK